FWIQRIPEHLRYEWNSVVEAQGHKLAYELSTVIEDLDSPQLWIVQLRAFDELKNKIIKAVCKEMDADAKRDDDSRHEVDWSQYIFLHPGELKALACESAGYMATAPTSGESQMP